MGLIKHFEDHVYPIYTPLYSSRRNKISNEIVNNETIRATIGDFPGFSTTYEQALRIPLIWWESTVHHMQCMHVLASMIRYDRCMEWANRKNRAFPIVNYSPNAHIWRRIFYLIFLYGLYQTWYFLSSTTSFRLSGENICKSLQRLQSLITYWL
jgi:hypothetical protein